MTLKKLLYSAHYPYIWQDKLEYTSTARSVYDFLQYYDAGFKIVKNNVEFVLPQGIGGKLKFIADSMLGRLAKWMRAMGLDVSYYRRIEDGELVDLAMKEGRLILTRDTLLIKRRKAKGNYFLVEGNSYKDQLRQVVGQFSIDPYKDLLTRCVECNLPLVDVDRETVKERVPEYVYLTQDKFRSCPKCHKIYWSATHKEDIMRTLKEIRPSGS